MADQESAILCDLAQFYNIYDWRQYEVGYIATLVCGLPQDSRTIKEISETDYSIDTLLNAIIADYLSYLLFVEIKKSTKKQVQQPKSILEVLRRNGDKNAVKNELRSYSTPEEFERARQKIIEG